MSKVYVARKSCGHIVAAFPLSIDRAVKGELLKQLSKAGYDVEQTTDGDVQMNYATNCDCNKPPLFAYADSRTEEGKVAAEGAGEGQGEEDPNQDGGAEASDVDAAANEDETRETDEPEADEVEPEEEVESQEKEFTDF